MKKLWILILSLAVLFMSGCERRPTPTAPGETAGNGITELTIWTTDEPRFFESLGREFASQIGAANLRFKVVTFEEDIEMQQVIVNSLSEGLGPDIIFTDGEWIAGNPRKLTMAKVESGFTPDNFRNTFVQSANDALLVGETGILGVPMAVDSLALLFNDEHLTDRLPDRNTPSTTWEGLREDAAVLSKKDNSFERFTVSGVALGRTDNINYGAEIIENIMLQSGVEFFDASQTLATFDKTEAVAAGGRKVNAGVEAVNFYTSFADERYKNHSWNAALADSSTTDKDLRTFAKGKTSMVFAKAQDLPRLQAIIDDLEATNEDPIDDDNIRVAFLPQVEDPQISPNRKVVGDVKALAVTRDSKFPDTAWRFLKFAIQKDNLQKWHEETLMPSPRLDLLLEQEQVPLVGIYVRQAKFARANLMPIPKAYFYEALKPGVEAINAGRMSSERALETSAFTVSKILQQEISRAKSIER
ncbi:extracellular solute-binding protein [bacterium]|nr:extracellular solute-binding protein [bacterium]NCQ55644.1 extracellular solute-binding protein [Candidatus Parcubacteria bacterium]NCS67469.1 extracellular solute-binding protein [Candidatus Peregrinibacteria bacterium]NCS96195.1 extracellular solute-binding protein [bacterium]